MVGRRCRAHPAASRRGVGDPAPHRRRRGPAAAYRPRPDARKASVHGGRDRRALPHPAPDVSVLAFLRGQIARLTSKEGRLGTARNYTRTLNSFSAFLGGTDLPFAAFTEPLVEEYNAYLVRRGVVRNTVSFYMRILRAVYNRAVRQRLTEQSFPFSGVYTGIDHTRKRAVEERLIGRLRNLDLSGSDALALARDLFIFSYCTRGMSFVDMAFLRKRDLSGGEINYVRRKTGQLMTVHLETCMREIVRRYEWRTRNTPYVFPLLTAEGPAGPIRSIR